MLHAIVNSLAWRVAQALLAVFMLVFTLWLWATQPGNVSIFFVLHFAGWFYLHVALAELRPVRTIVDNFFKLKRREM